MANSNRPFRFQPMWLSHKDFPTIVRELWEGRDEDLSGVVTRFTQKAQT